MESRDGKIRSGEGREPLLDSAMRSDVMGVVLVVVGIVLLVAVIAPGNAVVTAALSSGLRHLLGLGAYILPFVIMLWGVLFFVKAAALRFSRVVIGAMMVLLALMSLFSLFNAAVDPASAVTLFDDRVLVGGGGWVGSGIAYALMSLFGRVIAAIVLVGVAVVGLVLTGVHVSTPFVYIRNLVMLRRQERAEQVASQGRTSLLDGHEDEYVEQEDSFEPYPDDSFADRTLVFEPADEQAAPGADETVRLGGREDDVEKTVALPRKRKGATVTKRARSRTVPAEDDAPAKPALSAGTSPTALDGFTLPDPGLLRVSGHRQGESVGELKQVAGLLQRTLEEFSLPAKVVGWLAGPTVTMFKVDLPSGVRLNKLVGLADDIALALAAEAVRIAQIPGTSLVGVEIPNKTRTPVLFGDILPACPDGPLQVVVGEDVDGDKICADLAKMPHLLIAGTTGSGKSVCLNGMIMTMLMRTTPAEVRMIMIDPKRVEFSGYNGIPHLLVPPVTEPKEAASALRWAVVEMEKRLKLFEKQGARNIGAYNQLVQDGSLDDEDGNRPDEMPYIVVVIDELSDLMMVAGKDVEDSIVRISQLARAAGIHLIVATQRPTSNVVTGMIKANITNRIALSVATSGESRVIIDQSGADKLVGHGDMLYAKPEWGKPKRIQGCFVDDAEINSVVSHLKEQGDPEYRSEILSTQLASAGGGGAAGGSGGGDGSEDDDPLLWEAAEAVVSAGLGSTSMLQRRLKVGYARAGRIMDMLEAKGVVGPPDGSRAREVLLDSMDEIDALRAFEAEDAEG